MNKEIALLDLISDIITNAQEDGNYPDSIEWLRIEQNVREILKGEKYESQN